MSVSRLHVIAPVTGKQLRSRQPRRGGVVTQIITAFAAENRLAAFIGLALGGFVPIATYLVAHRANSVTSLPAVLAIGGLAFSAPTVYSWARAALGSTAKAGGFVLLLEGVMILSSSIGLAWLGVLALGYLVLINATATACRLALGTRC
ncbi:MAG TPA: hypothetical protein VFR23_24775 [Jiangellaceae bacterium]|nr:hypothetical protein [Jiangellaceae bacterium]